MKLRKFIAAVAASTVAVSAMAISAFAAETTINKVTLNAQDDAGKLVQWDIDVFTGIEKIDTVTIKGTASVDGWCGGGGALGFDATTGWTQIDFALDSAGVTLDAATGVFTAVLDFKGAVIDFAKEDAIMQLGWWWGSGKQTMELNDMLINGESVIGRTVPAKPVETEPVETEPVEEPTEEPVVVEPTEEPVEEPTEEPTEEPAGEAEVDWDAYDLDAAVAANEAFVFGEGQTIDLYAVLGDDLYELNKIDATFTWDAGTAWCGGAGLGNGIVLDTGADWTSGPEYGAANANEVYVNDGVATQTIIDLGDAVIDQIATVGDDGVTAFGALFVQNWWNGVEANAQLASLTFYNADGDVIGELVYSKVEAPAENEPAQTPSEDKGNPDTGVEGIAIVAGLAAVAGAAFVISRKRK